MIFVAKPVTTFADHALAPDEFEEDHED
jgi:hypothetical protein